MTPHAARASALHCGACAFPLDLLCSGCVRVSAFFTTVRRRSAPARPPLQRAIFPKLRRSTLALARGMFVLALRHCAARHLHVLGRVSQRRRSRFRFCSKRRYVEALQCENTSVPATAPTVARRCPPCFASRACPIVSQEEPATLAVTPRKRFAG